jgi:hypothetical protein
VLEEDLLRRGVLGFPDLPTQGRTPIQRIADRPNAAARITRRRDLFKAKYSLWVLYIDSALEEDLRRRGVLGFPDLPIQVSCLSTAARWVLISLAEDLGCAVLRV